MKAYHLDVENTRSRVQYLYRMNPDITVTQIAKRIGITDPTVAKYLIPLLPLPAFTDVRAEVRRYRRIRPRITAIQIAKDFGINDATVFNYINSDCKPSNKGLRLYYDTEDIRFKVRQTYLNRPELTVCQIATQFGISKSSAYNYIKKIKRRSC